jgi:hypothetical protein
LAWKRSNTRCRSSSVPTDVQARIIILRDEVERAKTRFQAYQTWLPD